MPVGGLDEPCGTCGRSSGDHTLREWAGCMGELTTDLPFEAMDPHDATTKAASAEIRRRFQLDEDLLIADHVVIKAAVLDGHTGPVTVKFPALIHDFGVGKPGQSPATIARVAYIGDVTSMRQYGRLARDSANGAANAAEAA
jgi:hypothetical protein